MSLRTFRSDRVESLKLAYASCMDFARSPLGICHALLAIYASGLTMQIALLPYIVMELQQPVQSNGYVLGLFSICQLVGAPIFGRIADAVGPRTAFELALASSSLMYILMAVAPSFAALLGSQLPGVFIHGFQAAMIIVAFETNDRQRTPHLAYLNLSYCTGMIVGGVIGASIAEFVGARGTLVVAAALQLFGCSIAFNLDEFNELFYATRSSQQMGSLSLKLELQRLAAIARKCTALCIVLVIGLFPYVRAHQRLRSHSKCIYYPYNMNRILLIRFAFTPVAVNLYHLTPSQTNVMVTVIGSIMVGIVAPLLASLYGDIACLKYACPLAAAGFLCLVFFPTPPLPLTLVLLLGPLCGGALLYICCTSQMTKRVDRSEYGSVVGLNACLFFLDAAISQIVGLPIYAAYGMQPFWLLCLFVMSVLGFYLIALDDRTFMAFSIEKDASPFPLQSVFQ